MTTTFDGILSEVFGMNNFGLYRFVGKNLHQFLATDSKGTFNWSERPIFRDTDKNVLTRRALAVPERRQQYLDMMAKFAVLAGGPGGWLEQENLREANQIRQAAYDDPVKQFSDGGVLKPSDDDRFEAEVAKNSQFARVRSAFVLPAVAAAGFQVSGGPRLSEGGAVNAATNLAGPIAPGALVSLYGSGLTDVTAQATTLLLPTSLEGVSVYINGLGSPLLFVSPNQINLQVPWELGLGTTPFTVIVSGPAYFGTVAGSPFNGTLSNTIAANVGPVSPGVFAVVQSDGSLTTNKPAGAGDILLPYANGLGPVDNPVATGQAAPTDLLVRTQQTPAVRVGDMAAEVLFSGLAPGFAGLYQVNIRMPPCVTPGSATSLVVSIGGQTAPL